jgi:hypothetical protein
MLVSCLQVCRADRGHVLGSGTGAAGFGLRCAGSRLCDIAPVSSTQATVSAPVQLFELAILAGFVYFAPWVYAMRKRRVPLT